MHRGPTVSLGYWNRPEDTAKVLRPHPFIPAALGGETVCYSGDLAVEDEDGFFSFVARNDAMIKSSGYRISPTEVEESLMSTGLFQQVAVIGLPDPFAGEKVHAVATAANQNIDVSAALKKPPKCSPLHDPARHRTGGTTADNGQWQGGLPRAGARTDGQWRQRINPRATARPLQPRYSA